MKFILSALSVLSLANAESTAALNRRLSYEKIAGYSPGSQVSMPMRLEKIFLLLHDVVAAVAVAGVRVFLIMFLAIRNLPFRR